MSSKYLSLLFIVILLVACEKQPPVQLNLSGSVCGDGLCSADESYNCSMDCEVKNVSAHDVISALQAINRTRPTAEFPVANKTKITINTTLNTTLPSRDFHVASRYNLLSIGENMSKVMGTLSGIQLREILSGGRLSSNTMAFGPKAATYSQELTLRSGKVVFGLADDKLTTYLNYFEGDQILEYQMTMRGGVFKFFEGEVIHFLGHDYFLYSVTNNTITLKGITTPDEIILRDGKGAFVNGKTIPNSQLNVTMDREHIKIIYRAPDDLQITPGNGLVESLHRPEMLLTNKIDLVYEGLTDAPCIDLKFDRSNDEYKLKFTTNLNLTYSVPLALLNPVKLGDERSGLVYQEGSSPRDYNIKEKDYFVVSNRKTAGGLSNVMRLVSIKEDSQLLTLQDPALETFYVYFTGTPGVNATGDLIIYNVRHKFYVGNGSISLDLNGDGSINRGKASIITAGNGILSFDSANGTINMTYTVPGSVRENNAKDLNVRLTITDEGIAVEERDLALKDAPESSSAIGMTDYGTAFILTHASSDQLGDDLTIQQPIGQRFADVVLKAYE